MRRKSLFVFFLVGNLWLVAQRGDQHFAFWGGMNLSNFSGTSPTVQSSTIKYGYSFFLGTRNYINQIPELWIGYQRKGGYNTLPVPSPGGGTGSETFGVDLSYISLIAPLKYTFNFGAGGHARILAGAFMDYLVDAKSHAQFASDPRNLSSYKKFSYGLFYGLDVNIFTREHFALAIGIYGQNGLTKAGDNSISTFKNNTYAPLLTIAFAP